MNFMRGRQMVVHDPNLNNPGNPTAVPPVPPRALRPPGAIYTWTVNPADPAAHIVGWVAETCKAGKLDALHFMAHGNKAFMKIGAESFSWANVNLFQKLKDKVGCIVFFSCLVGSDEASYAGHAPVFGQRVAELTNAKVVACRENQQYSWDGSNTIDFGDWEGEVYVFQPGGSYLVFNSPNPFREQPKLDLERLVFG